MNATSVAPATGVPLIELDGVTKRYGSLTAVEDVTFRVARGEVVGLIGANGAGKSTLMRLVAGDERPDEGRLLVNGEPTSFTAPRQAIATGIAIVPQEVDLISAQSVGENLLIGDLPRRLGFLKPREVLGEARRHLERVGLDVAPSMAVEDLTPVEQRLVSIAQALARKPRILMLDEPSAALPTETAARLEPLIGLLAASGTAVVYVSHRLEEIQRLCSRVVAMRDGRVSGTLIGSEIALEPMIALIGGGALLEEPPAAAGSAAGRESVITTRALSGSRVRDLDLSVSRGELLGVGGLHGSGRSELLRLICGVQPPAAGSVEVLGAPGPRSPGEAAKRGIGYLAEGREQMLFRDLSTRANASIAVLSSVSRLRTVISGRRERSRVAASARAVGLRGEIEAGVTTLSGGNQQKVCLMRWLLRECDLLVLDEPTAGIDVHARAEIHRILRELVATGTTIVVASAEPEELALLCDRVVILVEGRVGGDLRSPLRADAVVRMSYSAGGSVDKTEHPWDHEMR